MPSDCISPYTSVAESRKTLSVVAEGAPPPLPPTLSVVFVTGFTFDWSSLGRSNQRSPLLRRVRSSDLSQPPALVSVAFILWLPKAELVASNVKPAMPLPSAKSSWLMPMIRYSSVLPLVSFIENLVPASMAALALA